MLLSDGQLQILFHHRLLHYIEYNSMCYIVSLCGLSVLFIFVVLVTKSCPTFLQPHGLQSAGLFCPWDFPVKNTVGGCHFLLQGILPTQGSNPCLLQLGGGFFTTEPLGKPGHLYTPDCTNVSIHPILLIYPFPSPFPLSNCKFVVYVCELVLVL